jgi:hypothetical protein
VGVSHGKCNDTKYESRILRRHIRRRREIEHRRFVDAVKAGLLLRDEFPQHVVQVHSVQVTDWTEALGQDRVLH